MNGKMREQMLEKLMDFFSTLPDKSESADSPIDGAKPGDSKLEMIQADAAPVDKKGAC
jgi:hypothetical protein